MAEAHQCMRMDGSHQSRQSEMAAVTFFMCDTSTQCTYTHACTHASHRHTLPYLFTLTHNCTQHSHTCLTLSCHICLAVFTPCHVHTHTHTHRSKFTHRHTLLDACGGAPRYTAKLLDHALVRCDSLGKKQQWQAERAWVIRAVGVAGRGRMSE